MRKKFKRKKKIKAKTLLIFFFIFILIILLYYLKYNFKTNINNNVINYILKNTNKNYSENNTLYSYINKGFLNSPTNILSKELNFDKENSQKVSLTQIEEDFPLIYIYNSHQGEKYSSEYIEDYNIIPNVMLADKILKEKLDNIGINTIIEESDILKYMEEHNLNHAGSYKASKVYLSKAIENYPTVKLFIDLHRDAINHDLSITKIDGKICAKVLFVIGLENPNYEKNLKIVNRINNIILNKFPTLTRGIMKKQGYGVNGVYNQDLDEKVILIEVGGNENTIDEVNNTLDILSIVIGEYLNEKEEN